jgi:hypothetical protein
MSHSTKAVATSDVLIITTSSVRGDDPTLEFSVDDFDELLNDGWTIDDEAKPDRLYSHSGRSTRRS